MEVRKYSCEWKASWIPTAVSRKIPGLSGSQAIPEAVNGRYPCPTVLKGRYAG